MWAHWGSEQQEELRYQVSYHKYVAGRGWLLYTPSVELVVGWTIRTSFSFWIFLSIISCLREKKIPGSPHFSVLQVTKSWAWPGNEAILIMEITELWTFHIRKLQSYEVLCSVARILQNPVTNLQIKLTSITLKSTYTRSSYLNWQSELTEAGVTNHALSGCLLFWSGHLWIPLRLVYTF